MKFLNRLYLFFFCKKSNKSKLNKDTKCKSLIVENNYLELESSSSSESISSSEIIEI